MGPWLGCRGPGVASFGHQLLQQSRQFPHRFRMSHEQIGLFGRVLLQVVKLHGWQPGGLLAARLRFAPASQVGAEQ